MSEIINVKPEDLDEAPAETIDIHPDELDAPAAPIVSPKADEIEQKISTAMEYAPTPENIRRFVTSKIPGGQYLEQGSDNIKTGLQEGTSAGLVDEIKGIAKGVGKTGLQAITGELPKETNALEDIYNNFRKYQKMEEDKIKAAHEDGYGAAVGNVAGSFIPGGAAFKAMKAAPLAAKVGLGTGLGAIEGFGRSEGNIDEGNRGQLALDTTISGALGAGGTYAGEKFVAPWLTNKLNKSLAKIQDTPEGHQLAAATLNASKGGTVFGMIGPQAIEIQNQNLADDTARLLSKGISEHNQKFTDAFEAAAQAGKTLEFGTAAGRNLSDLGQDLGASRIRLAPEHVEILRDFAGGGLTPDRANKAIQYFKQIRYENIDNPQLKNSLSNIIDDLTNAANKTLDGTTLQKLNTGKSTAWSQVEPFIQKANEIIPELDFQNLSASDLPPELIKRRISDIVKSLANKAGSSTGVGTRAQVQIQELQQALKDVNASVNFPGVNPSEIASSIQNQGYLNAAVRSRQGERVANNLGVDKIDVWGRLKNEGLLYGAEKLSKFKTAQDVASRILSKDPLQVRANAEALSQNPKTRKLAEDLIKAHELNNNQKITNTMFQLFQNPAAKAALGGVAEEIPGVRREPEE